MKILRIKENPFSRWEVKNLPKDAKYVQHDINDNEVYYSKFKDCYYVVIR